MTRIIPVFDLEPKEPNPSRLFQIRSPDVNGNRRVSSDDDRASALRRRRRNRPGRNRPRSRFWSSLRLNDPTGVQRPDQTLDSTRPVGPVHARRLPPARTTGEGQKPPPSASWRHPKRIDGSPTVIVARKPPRASSAVQFHPNRSSAERVDHRKVDLIKPSFEGVL